MGMTDYLEGKLSDHTVRHVSYTSPTTVYLALFTSATDDTGGGTECTGGSYARQAAAFSASWITSGTITADAPVLNATQTWNNAAVTFTAIKLNVTASASGASKMPDTATPLSVAAVANSAVLKNALRSSANMARCPGLPYATAPVMR